MAFPSLQAEQGGGTAITLHVGLNTHERLMAKRGGRRPWALMTTTPKHWCCSLEREHARRAPGSHVGSVSNPATSLYHFIP